MNLSAQCSAFFLCVTFLRAEAPIIARRATVAQLAEGVSNRGSRHRCRGVSNRRAILAL